MSNSSTFIWFAIIIVIFVIVLFVVGIYTRLSGTVIVLVTFAFLSFFFIITAGYAADAAGKTGGNSVDDANREAHGYYTWAAVIAWIVVGVTVIAFIALIIGAVFVFGSGAGEAAAVGEEGFSGIEALEAAKAAGGSSKVSSKEVDAAILQIQQQAKKIGTKEALDLAEDIKKDKARGLFDSLNKNESFFGKLIKWVILLSFYTVIGLSLAVGLLLAIGASIQGGSEYKKGLKKAAFGATISLFLGGMIIIFLVTMQLRKRSLQKKLFEDEAEFESLRQTALIQKAQQIRELTNRGTAYPGPVGGGQ